MVRRALVAVLVVVGAALGPSCREATQVLVEARTNVSYQSGMLVSFTVGSPGQTEDAVLTTETREPWGPDGVIGSLTVVPATRDDASLSVKLVLGVSRTTETCVPPEYSGCIVARRKLAYVPHTRLRLPVTLYAQCKDVPCDAESTCNILGQCVSAEVTCVGETCTVAGEPGPGDDAGLMPVSTDATPAESSTEASAPDGGEAGSSVDASPDAPGDGGYDGPKDAGYDVDDPCGGTNAGYVECKGTPSGTCSLAAGERCCFDPFANAGICVPTGNACEEQTISAQCDGQEDCPGGRCCMFSFGAACVDGPCPEGSTQEVCHSDGVCSSGNCTENSSGYRMCL